MRRCAATAIGPLIAVLLLLGCGQKKEAAADDRRDSGAAPAAATAVAEPALHGTVVAVRPVPADGGATFAMLAVPAAPIPQVRLAAASTVAAPPAVFEFVVRVGAGTLCVVQPNPDGLRPGERVDVIRAERTRLARPG